MLSLCTMMTMMMFGFRWCYISLSLLLFQQFVPGDDRVVELDHEGGALVPVDGDFGWLESKEKDEEKLVVENERQSVWKTYEIALVEYRLDDAADKGGAVDELLVLRHGDELVDDRLTLDDVVFGRRKKPLLAFLETPKKNCHLQVFLSSFACSSLSASFPNSVSQTLLRMKMSMLMSRVSRL